MKLTNTWKHVGVMLLLGIAAWLFAYIGKAQGLGWFPNINVLKRQLGTNLNSLLRLISWFTNHNNREKENNYQNETNELKSIVLNNGKS